MFVTGGSGSRGGDHLVATGGPPGNVLTGKADYSIAYDDAYLLVVYKPAGVVVHPARGHWSGTLAQALAGDAAGGEEGHRAGIVHRLDRDTSGLLVVARSDAVHRQLKAMLAKRELHREYLALVDGVPQARTGTIEAPIGRDRRDRVLMSLDTDTPREARTHFEVIEALTGAALLRVVLDTGRTHQIRVHMRAIGHPVSGDQSYGGSRRFGLERQFLHAARLDFQAPGDRRHSRHLVATAGRPSGGFAPRPRIARIQRVLDAKLPAVLVFEPSSRRDSPPCSAR